MRLFEAVMEANHRSLAGDKTAGLHPAEFVDALPVIALTCIDPRLNALLPGVLGIPPEKFIWLRNAGNIITGPMSSTMRSLALACVVKKGREIVILGHTDCAVGRMTMLEMTNRFQALGVARSQLPDDLTDFFGVFASERQNVMRGVEFARKSPLIGPKVPVHGLLVDTASGQLEWIVNGYEALRAATSERAAEMDQVGRPLEAMQAMPGFNVGEMKPSEPLLGEPAPVVPLPPAPNLQTPAAPNLAAQPSLESKLSKDASGLFKIMGVDRKVYGPVAASQLAEWIADGRIDGATLAQKLGSKDWKPLAHFLNTPEPPVIPASRAGPVPRSPHPRK